MLVEARQGKEAGCHMCWKPIEWGEERIVVNNTHPVAIHPTTHYHITCAQNATESIGRLRDVLSLLEGNRAPRHHEKYTERKLKRQLSRQLLEDPAFREHMKGSTHA